MSQALRREWLEFEKELGFRPLLTGPTYDDIIAQDAKNGEALIAKFTFPGPDKSIHRTEHVTETGVHLKSYTPPNFKPGQPIVLYIHGGGFALGSVDLDDRFCNVHSKDTGCMVVSVEYRLAPRHNYPTALSDCVEGAGWCIENAESLDCLRGRIVIMGKSAGGSLALGTALKLIDGGRGANIVGVVACQPCTVHPNNLPPGLGANSYQSYEENATNTVNTKDGMLAFYAMLTASKDLYGAPQNDPFTYPLLHPMLGFLPKVYVNTCGADTLRDDGRLLKAKLDEEGVPSKYDEFEGLPHYFFAFPSTHLEALRQDYFKKTSEGIRWVIDSEA